MSQPNRATNPLLNNAVTGGTFEDFSQNALLFPAKEKTPKPPPPIHPVPQVQPVNQQQNQTQVNPTTYFQPQPEAYQNEPIFDLNQQYSTQFDQNQQYPPINQQYPNQFGPNQQHPQFQQEQIQFNPNQSASQPSGSNFSSVLSSFSSILKLGNSPQEPPITDSVPPPAGIDQLITTNPNPSIEPVPLFPLSEPPLQQQPPVPPQGTGNNFRRTTNLKRPVYAPLPGLATTTPLQPQINNPPPTNPSNPPPIFFNQNQPTTNSSILTEFIPTETTSPVLPTVLSGSETYPPQNHFKPISPQPSTFYPPPVHNQQSMAAVFEPPPNLPQILPTTQINQPYRPVYHHWFYKRLIEGKTLWQPFSMVDSLALDDAFTSSDLDPTRTVATDGGRYDVNILRRERVPVYWNGTATEVRRCSWFHKNNSDGRYLPYEENIATRLEDEYKVAYEANQWNRKVELSNAEIVVFHAPDIMTLSNPIQADATDVWGNPASQSRPRMVKRGLGEFHIDEGEPPNVDHVLFMVHGIGSVCDLKFRTVEEVVDEFRSIALQLVQSHYKSSCENGIVHRVEVLPISWHEELHSEETGVDNKLKSITLKSIPRLRDFTNDTILDVLFYTSPIYCQTIVSTVGNQLNSIYGLFQKRNPNFSGGVSLAGHSLGSLILFDLLCHQQPDTEPEAVPSDEDKVPELKSLDKPPPLDRKFSRRISYMMARKGTGQPQIHYPHLSFQPKAFFALGSPIGMFVTVRGLDSLGEKFVLPTCPAFLNIFHPYDPVAYRIEALVNPDLATLKPVLIPHHKGRKRMHLELKETMARVGADLKQKVFDSMKSTWNSFYQLAMFHRQDQPSLEEEVDKALQAQMLETADFEEPEEQITDLPLGLLNNNRRIDHVLQEAPFEFFNEYIFALTSHVGYWDSEDTILLILKEIYSSMEISTDDKIPQQTMTIERPPSSPKPVRQTGVDPTVPPPPQATVGQPPLSGFVRNT